MVQDVSVSLSVIITVGCLMSHAQPQLLDPLPHAQLTSTPSSVLLTSHRDHHCEDDPRQGAEFGRLAEQVPLTEEVLACGGAISSMPQELEPMRERHDMRQSLCR